MENTQSLINRIKILLAKAPPREIEVQEGPYRHAAVLVPLMLEERGLKILFTKRTHKVDQHKGQISFPGGAVDQSDLSFEHTALRETEEEVGLSPHQVEIVGRLDDTFTLVSNFIIHPVVGIVPSQYDYDLNSFEVEKIIQVPLRAFSSCTPEQESSFTYQNVTYKTPCYKYDGEVIWGATARIMRNFMEVVGKELLLLEQAR